MKFHLNYSPLPALTKIGHKDPVLLAGSCFSAHIGHNLEACKFETLVNPNGIMFNPISICDSLKSICLGLPVKENQVVDRAGMFLSYQHHSSINATGKTELLILIRQQQERAHQFLKRAKFLIITFGSAFVYFHKELNSIVANCHKQNASLFKKKLLEVSEIVDSCNELLQILHKINPALQVIFTVSPVKHLRDGIEANSLSKATLLLGISKILKTHAQASYFPAFELINDDLRDYRFYEADLSHPNALAIDYVWNKFATSFFEESTQLVNAQITKLNRALKHRSMSASTSEKQKHHEYILNCRAELKRLLPGIEF